MMSTVSTVSTMSTRVSRHCYQASTNQLLNHYDVYNIYSLYSLYKDFQGLLMSSMPAHLSYTMISSLHHHDVASIPDSLIPHSSCTRRRSSYFMQCQPASLVCP